MPKMKRENKQSSKGAAWLDAMWQNMTEFDAIASNLDENTKLHLIIEAIPGKWQSDNIVSNCLQNNRAQHDNWKLMTDLTQK